MFNSILGDIQVPQGVKKITLLQDNFVLMHRIVPFDWKRLVKWFLNFGRDEYLIKEAIQRKAIVGADIVVAVSKNTAGAYGIKDASIIPIGTDAELFRPLGDQKALRERYGIPNDKRVKIFVGSTHPVKGFDALQNEIEKDSDSFYIVVLKDRHIPALGFPNAKVFQRIPQTVLAQLYNCADLFVGRSRVETLWLAPIEAMFCGVPVDVTPVGIFADWRPENKNPRAEAFKAGLDKATMITRWADLVSSI